jgi:hypothetical protein
MHDILEDSPKTQATLPPGLDNILLTYGFDATIWDFREQQVLELSFDKKASFSLGDTSYAIPDDSMAESVDHASGTTATAFRGIKTVDENDFSESVNASISADEIGLSVSASEAVALKSTVKDDSQWTTTLISYFLHSYRFSRPQPQPSAVTPAFQNAVDALPSDYLSGDDSFASFFQTWGTHVLTAAHLGGTWRMSTAIHSDVYDSLSSQKVTTSVEASFNSGAEKTDAKTEITNETQHELGITTKNSLIVFDCVGGTPNTDLNTWLGSVTKDMQFLNDATAVNTQEIRPQYTPIWTLVSDSVKSAAMQKAWQDYLGKDRHPDTSLPARITVPVNSVQQAASDGFVTSLMSASNPDGGAIFGYTDSSPSPATLVASAAVHVYETASIVHASLVMPVRANDYYNVQYNQTWGDVTPPVAFQPFPLELGARQALALNEPYTAETDGFVTGTIDYVIDGNRGFLLLQQATADGGSVSLAGASVHQYVNFGVYVPTESFCIPLVKGTAYMVALTSTYGTVEGAATWIPMGSTRVLGTPIARTTGQAYQADTDGMLVAMLSLTDDGHVGGPGFEIPAYGSLTLDMSQEADFTDSIQLSGAAVDLSDYHMEPCNSATAIIPQGNWYRATLGSCTTYGNFTATLFWYPIVQPQTA